MTTREDAVRDLVEAGLSEAEARVYALLAAAGPLTASGIAKQAGLARTRVYAALEAVESKGLAESLLAEPRRFSALPLGPFLDRAIEKAERDAAAAEELRSRLADAYAPARPAAESAVGTLRAARGRREAGDALARAILDAKELRWLTTPEGVLRLANHLEGADAVERIARREVDARVVLALRATAREGAREDAERVLAGVARALPVPEGLATRLVADGRLLLAVASPEDERAYRGDDLLLDSRVPAMVADAATLIDRLWRTQSVD